jgi:hypothetical protein
MRHAEHGHRRGLNLSEGDSVSLAAIAPVDVVVANHVL